MDRRSVLRATTVGIGAFAGCLGGGDGGPSRAEVDDWLANARGFESVVDRTGNDRVTVRVGAGDGLSFDPAGVRVSAGTTVVWEWTGQGGQHNVVSREGLFDSAYASSAGHTFEYDFGDPGNFRYYCKPHESVGMKGAILVE